VPAPQAVSPAFQTTPRTGGERDAPQSVAAICNITVVVLSVTLWPPPRIVAGA
jgi:hypothetical protein